MICVDASVAAKWLVPEIHSDLAERLLADALGRGEIIVAPPLLRTEVTNILRQQMRRTGLALEDATVLLAEFLAVPISYREPLPLYAQALAVAAQFSFPATYDAQYVALAEALGAVLWTADTRVLNIVAGKLSFVRSLDQYRSET